MREMEINGEQWVLKSESSSHLMSESFEDMEYCVVRTYSAGVHIGYVKERNGKEITLVNSRRLYSWSGACSLSQVAVDGVDTGKSKVAMVIPSILLTECIEVIPATSTASNCIQGAPVWES